MSMTHATREATRIGLPVCPSPSAASRQPNPLDLPEGFRLSVVVPVYNEAATIETLLWRVRQTGLASEITVVDDGSTDGTAELLRRFDGQAGFTLLRHACNQGKGAALRTAFRRVTGDAVVIQDADLEYDPADYPRLLRPLVEGQADVVFGTRFADGRGTMPRWRYAGNRLLTWLSNRFTTLRLADMETGAKAFRRSVLERIAPNLQETGFGIEPELTARLAAVPGARIAQVPVTYCPRRWAEGKKIGWRDGLRAVWCIVKYGRGR
jgi:glycosyltransferase involved in cell wall biosynthesis